MLKVTQAIGLIISLFTGLLLSPNLHAQVDHNYLTIGEVQTTEVFEDEVLNLENMLSSNFSTKPVVKNVTAADVKCQQAAAKGLTSNYMLTPAEIAQIIKIGKEVWEIVEKNKPVVNVASDSVTLVPVKAECWRWMTGWQNPVSRSFRTQYKNLYGITVVDFTYKLIFVPGGTYNGRGKYLANVTIVPSNLRVLWGYKFNASVSVPSVLNYGTVVDPVAAAEIQLKYSVDTVLGHDSATVNFLVKGTGEALAL